MKTKTTCLISALLLSAATVLAQTTGGGGAATGAGGGARGAGATIAPATVVPNPNPNGPRLLQRGTVMPNQGTVSQGAVSANGSQMMTTNNNNNFAGATNGFAGTNGLAGTGNNPNSVTASVNPITNGFVNTNTEVNGNVVVRDQAVTPSDRILLTTISQGVKATLGITPNGNLPVHFMINNGTVTVVGTVQSAQQSQSVLAQVQQTPGVATVINDLHVAPAFGVAQTRPATPNGLFAASDHAFSPADQTLLTTVQQEAALQLGVTSSTQMPVHFSIQNGVVGVTGQVSSLQEKQALLAAIGRTKGIVRVVDNVGVLNGAAGLGLNTAAPGNTGNLPTTSRTGGSNTMFLNSTNASGF